MKQLIARDPWIPPCDSWKSCWQSSMLEYGEPHLPITQYCLIGQILEAEQNKKWSHRLWKRLTFWKEK